MDLSSSLACRSRRQKNNLEGKDGSALKPGLLGVLHRLQYLALEGTCIFLEREGHARAGRVHLHIFFCGGERGCGGAGFIVK